MLLTPTAVGPLLAGAAFWCLFWVTKLLFSGLVMLQRSTGHPPARRRLFLICHGCSLPKTSNPYFPFESQSGTH